MKSTKAFVLSVTTASLGFFAGAVAGISIYAGRLDGLRPLARDFVDFSVIGLVQYLSTNNQYPDEKDGLSALFSNGSRIGYLYGTLEEFEARRDPWGNPYRFEISSDPVAMVSSDGPDGLAGTIDDVTGFAYLRRVQSLTGEYSP